MVGRQIENGCTKAVEVVEATTACISPYRIPVVCVLCAPCVVILSCAHEDTAHLTRRAGDVSGPCQKS